MAVSGPAELEKVNSAREAIRGKLEVSMASSHPNNIEFTSIEANKGTALIRYQELTNETCSKKFLLLEMVEMTLNNLKWQLHLLLWKMLLSQLNKKLTS